jgi:hypothetical protein
VRPSIPFLFAFAWTALFACSDDGSKPAPATAAPPAGGSDAGASAEAGPAGPPPCPEGSRASGDGCETTLALAPASQSITPARDHHTTHVVEMGGSAFLYVLGGTPGWKSIYDDVQRAKIKSDGSLEAFAPAGTLRAKRAGHVSAFYKDKVILIGGSVARGLSMAIDRTSDVGTIGPDGALGGWTEGPTLPEAVMHATIEIKGEYLFVFGGRGQTTGASVDQVVRSKLGSDGTPGAFEAIAPLPESRSHHMSFQYGDYVYVAGGLTGDPVMNPPSRKDIIRAKLGVDGSLGDWEPAGVIPKGLSISAAQVFARRVFFFGGLPVSGNYTNVIQSAAFDPDGLLGETKPLPVKLSVGRGHVHQTPMYGRFIYSVAGKHGIGEDDSTGSVEIGTFSAP